MKQVILVPGAVAADGKVSIPAYLRDNRLLRSLKRYEGWRLTEAAPNTYTVSVKTIVAPTNTPGAGNACIDPARDGVRCGDALIISDQIYIAVELDFELLRA